MRPLHWCTIILAHIDQQMALFLCFTRIFEISIINNANLDFYSHKNLYARYILQKRNNDTLLVYIAQCVWGGGASADIPFLQKNFAIVVPRPRISWGYCLEIYSSDIL